MFHFSHTLIHTGDIWGTSFCRCSPTSMTHKLATFTKSYGPSTTPRGPTTRCPFRLWRNGRGYRHSAATSRAGMHTWALESGYRPLPPMPSRFSWECPDGGTNARIACFDLILVPLTANKSMALNLPSSQHVCLAYVVSLLRTTGILAGKEIGGIFACI